MKRTLSLVFALLGWLAIGIQYGILVQNRILPLDETTIRFFSYFTILTNTFVAVYFTLVAIHTGKQDGTLYGKPGVLTALTTYILIVGLVYQVVLRHLWSPQGMHMLADETLHTIIPLCVLLFWILYEQKQALEFRMIIRWLIFPLLYLIYILTQGQFTNFYPYPFIDVTQLGMAKVLAHSAGLMALFVFLAGVLVVMGKRMKGMNPFSR